MATITEPMALDKTFNTTETTPRSQADVLAAIENAIRQGFGRSAADVSYDNTTSGLTADDVQEAIDELAAEKVDKVEGKGLSSNDFTDEDKAALDNMELDIESTQTVSGNPLTLTDCAPINAESLVVEFDPNQDLHGQSAPYVGGAGKNKLPMTVDGIKAANTAGTWNGNVYTIVGLTFTVNTDDGGNVSGITISGHGTDNVNFFVASNLILTSASILNLSSDKNTTNNDADFYVDGIGIGSSNWISGSANISAGTCQTIAIYLNTNYNDTITIHPMIRLATETDPTFAPYSNICPITGYTQTSVEGCGKNRFDIESWLTERSVSYTKSGKSYTFYATQALFFNPFVFSDTDIISNFNANISIPSGSSASGVGFNLYNANGDNVVYRQSYTNESGCSLRFDFSNPGYVTVTEPILTFGNDSVTPYEPYASTSATIQFGQTVYGAEVDFEGGTKDTWAKFDTYSGWYKASTDTTVIICEISGKKSGTNQIYCYDYKYVANQGFNVPDGAISDSTNSSYLSYVFINDSRFAGKTVQECEAILESDSMYFVYQLEIPNDISTPRTPLKLFKGTNNLSADGVMQIGYQPDNVIGEVKGEIEKCAVDAEFMQFTDGTDTFTDVNLSLDASFHTVSVVGSKIEQKRFICFEVMDKMGGVLQGILASCIAFTDGAKTPSGTAFRAYIESLQMYVNFRIYGSGGSYTLAYQSETSFSASAFYVRVRMMNNL